MREAAFTALCELVEGRIGADVLGDQAPLARDAFRKSLIGQAFPGIWFEVPLAGEPGFDLHVYYDRGTVKPGERFATGSGFGQQGLFDWFFQHERGGVGIGFAHDLRAWRGSLTAASTPGVYVNFNRRPLENPHGFLGAYDASRAAGWLDTLLARLPRGWRPWYLGTFAGRPGNPVRLGCFLGPGAQASYAADPARLAQDLARVGFSSASEDLLQHVAALAGHPFQLEVQLDLMDDGSVGDTLGVDLTLGARTPKEAGRLFAPDGKGRSACELLEAWGFTDERAQSVMRASVAQHVSIPDVQCGTTGLAITCMPAFIKAKWKGGVAQEAKVYLSCRIVPMRSDRAST